MKAGILPVRTLNANHVKKASTEVNSAAAGREDKKVEKYSNLSENYHFVPVGIETFGAYGPQAIKLIKQIGKKNTGSYRGKFVHFLSHAKNLNGNTKRKCGLC